MRRQLLAIAALSCWAASGQAQAPAKQNKSEFRVGGFTISGERAYQFLNSNIQTEKGSTKGVEFLARTGGIGIYVRSLSGTYGTQPQVISADARLLFAPPKFTFFLGAGKRALVSPLNTKSLTMGVVGISSTLTIGGSGLRTHISFAGLVAPEPKTSGSSGSGSGSNAKNTSTGLDGEASLIYRVPKLPLYVSLGYRNESFTTKTGGTLAPEELRGMRIGGGIQFGGH